MLGTMKVLVTVLMTALNLAYLTEFAMAAYLAPQKAFSWDGPMEIMKVNQWDRLMAMTTVPLTA